MPTRLRTLTIFVALIACAAMTWKANVMQAADMPPNIVMIFVDDMGPMDLGCYGSTFHQTPNMDKLSAQGMRFNQAYAACAVCSPTRVSLYTGQYPARTGTTNWIRGSAKQFPHEKLSEPADWNVAGLKDAWTTLPEVLKTAGYTTASFGKWHAGGSPADHGFDQSYDDWSFNREENQADPKGVSRLTKMATDFIHENDKQPVFVVISHFAVHTPIRFNNATRDAYAERVEQDNPQTNADYAAMVDELDRSVGQLLDFLDQTGAADHTLVILYADNGGLDLEVNGRKKGPANNDPLRGSKGSQYEGGLRVPLLVRWPGRVPANQTNDIPIITPDFLPTLAEIAGVDPAELPQTVDGVSFASVLTENGSLADRPLYWHFPHYHPGGRPGSVIRVGDQKLIYRPDDKTVELFDLAQDPREASDLSAQMPEQTEQLNERLQSWLDQVDAPRAIPNPNYKRRRARY
ncbi:sulfatase [Allorhodopirellula heiligendammensis]|uniref:Arylsulfatase n=1 Tax=Allorhodopirellula heiligendammensis TaxID=2714739 RepID=A0A5C6BD19_9BACT|nr:sulfatase [Allorhodopirellula heiligendammensis]TWU10003.1 Arylsulfatase precursor [Allorhodopirellula heiligendammensis]